MIWLKDTNNLNLISLVFMQVLAEGTIRMHWLLSS